MTDKPAAGTDQQARRAGSGRRPNAFERAREAALNFGLSLWSVLPDHLNEALPQAQLTPREIYPLGQDDSTIGAVVLERRTIRLPDAEGQMVDAWTLTRPTEAGWASLPPEVIEELADMIIDEAETEHRAANIRAMVDAMQDLAGEDGLSLAREVLGPDAGPEALEAFAAQLRFPEEILAGGESAARFFDDHVGLVELEEDEQGHVRLGDPAPTAPDPVFTGDSEWDYYSPEELEERGGPESDRSYAFRIKRLCEAMRERPDRAMTLGIQMGAVLREWAIWREFDEFILAGVAAFQRQSRRAPQKPERPWMKHVREDVIQGRVTDNVAAYARQVSKMRALSPPSLERIRNYVYEVRRSLASPPAGDLDRRYVGRLGCCHGCRSDSHD